MEERVAAALKTAARVLQHQISEKEICHSTGLVVSMITILVGMGHNQ